MAEEKKTLVHFKVKDSIALFTLDDPPANTYTYEMMRQLDDCILRARMRDDVHVIVITGQGEKFFSAGANIQMLTEVTFEFKYCFCLHANETLMRLEQTPKLVIAALNGHTVGGGLEIAMAADIRIARQGGGKIGLPEVNLGVLPGTGGTQRMARLLGKSKAIQLMAEGRTFDFEEGLELGLVNEVWEADSHEAFMDRVLEYAGGFTPPARASKAVGFIKRSVQTGWELPLAEALAVERELQQQLFESGDAREGLTAYKEKRKPEFEGS
ncbi:MAG TPA: enoyl-CoA hydratase/isomerase family protein [Longimicrobiales bacterium]|nr:enoyl-CoA hydratase/isomerase family protein [Longimicrobiales bacterium]